MTQPVQKNQRPTELGAVILQTFNLGKEVTDAGEQVAILRDINLQLCAGESLAITGASGSGKTTLLSLIAGLEAPGSGDVMLAGRALGALSEDQRLAWCAQHSSIVFQEFELLEHLTALENVMLPLELRNQRGAAERARAELERVGLQRHLHHKPATLSGGEQQRVALARAFVTEPPLLLADEPTGSLDAATGTRIADLMFSLRSEHGTALLLVTHDESLAQRCQQRIHLQAGRVDRYDPPQRV